jgi:hypothetical protein
MMTVGRSIDDILLTAERRNERALLAQDFSNKRSLVSVRSLLQLLIA